MFYEQWKAKLIMVIYLGLMEKPSLQDSLWNYIFKEAAWTELAVSAPGEIKEPNDHGRIDKIHEEQSLETGRNV